MDLKSFLPEWRRNNLWSEGLLSPYKRREIWRKTNEPLYDFSLDVLFFLMGYKQVLFLL